MDAVRAISTSTTRLPSTGTLSALLCARSWAATGSTGPIAALVRSICTTCRLSGLAISRAGSRLSRGSSISSLQISRKGSIWSKRTSGRQAGQIIRRKTRQDASPRRVSGGRKGVKSGEILGLCVVVRALVGGSWGCGSSCGSRSVSLGRLSSFRSGGSSGRLASATGGNERRTQRRRVSQPLGWTHKPSRKNGKIHDWDVLSVNVAPMSESR